MEKVTETLDTVHASALELREDNLWNYDFFEGFSE